ncbi:hypothetical protein BSKO_09961 [Bryopsis sp. KO-2023]|nr:hypothetical protein BSKO_09961 [Bryopsis sp. KO-2023]
MLTGSRARIRELFKKYGTTAVGTYLTVHATTFTCCYVAVESKLDVRGLLTRIGLLDVPTNDSNAEEKENTRWYESVIQGKGSSLALAFLCSKALIPVKVPVAVGLTPVVHRNLVRLGVVKAH